MTARKPGKTAKPVPTPAPSTYPPRGTLACGCQIRGVAKVSNPDRWFCCGAWQTRKKP